LLLFLSRDHHLKGEECIQSRDTDEKVRGAEVSHHNAYTLPFNLTKLDRESQLSSVFLGERHVVDLRSDVAVGSRREF
jgi:hypothetical protein